MSEQAGQERVTDWIPAIMRVGPDGKETIFTNDGCYAIGVLSGDVHGAFRHNEKLLIAMRDDGGLEVRTGPRWCDICGCNNEPFVDVASWTGEIFRVCKHGHFEGSAVDAHTGVLREMTGDRPLHGLVWNPGRYVPYLMREAQVNG